MRYLLVLLLSLSLLLQSLSIPALAQKKIPPGQKKKIAEIRERLNKLPPAERQAAIQTLNTRLVQLRRRVGLARMRQRHQALEDEIWLLERELEILKELQKAPPPPASPAPARRPAPPRQTKVRQPRSLQVGLSAGYMAGMLGAMGEIRFHNPLDLLRTSLRLGIAYAQGEDTDKAMRKHALIVLDGIYRLNPPQTRGIRNYFGLGVNYDVYTTGRVSGAMGGQVFYGVEGGPPAGAHLFFEVGYGTIRTGFSPDYAGLSALVGYKF